MAGVDPRAEAARLYDLHAAERDADDEALAWWPGDTELWGVLRWAESHARALNGDGARQEAALLRTRLIQWLREQTDALQLRAVGDAREAGVSWERLAPALGVESVNGAYNKARRLKVAVEGDPEDRRSPDVARLIEERAAAEALARRRTEALEGARFPAIAAACRALLHNRRDLATDKEDPFWMDQLAAVVDDRHSPAERAMLTMYLRNAVRETYQAAKASASPAASTPEALAALEAAAHLAAAPTEGLSEDHQPPV
ncbi:hypothetical protein P3T27_007969 [Kitasatospora sp. MAA19]|uniref:hypothetical protein n=1 Tax=unclassified Kitasatospora TaxID=2633591 RepID=UPI002472F28E|nr:hypothetical protein [Kitasatospora sp. MAA19]MDH6711216.1 hypothetical protein [Kitasatospora sp. MAA19]